MKAARGFKPDLLAHLKKTQAAAAYLNAALEDDDPRAFLVALRDVADARGNISNLAKQSAIKRESFYKITSRQGNPSLSNVLNIIRTLGLKIRIEKSGKLAA